MQPSWHRLRCLPDSRGAGGQGPATPAAVGTVAHITDFYRDDDGLLGIVAEGGARFRVARTRVRADGLLRGDVEFWPDEPVQPVPVEFVAAAEYR